MASLLQPPLYPPIVYNRRISGRRAIKAVDKAYRIVRGRILSGNYRPGARITEHEVVKISGVSRTPVREAFFKLQSEGLVRSEPNMGVVVCDLSPGEADDIFALRVLLESYGARLAAERIHAEDVARLQGLAREQLQEAARPSPDLDRIAKLNAEFHGTLYRASGNSRLASILTMLMDPTLVLRTFEYYSPDALRRSAREHVELAEMLGSRFADGAEALMRTHVLAARHEYQKHHPATFPRASSPAPEGEVRRPLRASRARKKQPA
jgi:DNA-binding GntR family transcriptional regulator